MTIILNCRASSRLPRRLSVSSVESKGLTYRFYQNGRPRCRALRLARWSRCSFASQAGLEIEISPYDLGLGGWTSRDLVSLLEDLNYRCFPLLKNGRPGSAIAADSIAPDYGRENVYCASKEKISYFPEVKFGGPPRKIHAMSPALRARRHSVNYLPFRNR